MPMTLYASVRSGGMYKSEDGGGSWMPFNTGLPGGRELDARAVLTDTVNPGRVYTLTAHGVFIIDEGPVCVGDCGGEQAVGINDLVTLVNIALETVEPAACAGGGLPIGGEVDIAVIIEAVGNALNGCSESTL